VSASHPPLPLTGLRVFISYPRGGRAHTWAERVEAALRDPGADPWRDESSVPKGDPDWLARLEQGLYRAQAVAHIIGQDTEGCTFQRREMLSLRPALRIPDDNGAQDSTAWQVRTRLRSGFGNCKMSTTDAEAREWLGLV